MQVAVSGASGFIGSSVAKQLAGTKCVVRIGRRSTCDIRVDFSKPESMENLDLRGCDAVVHCAGVVDEDFKSNPTSAYIQSTLGLCTFLQRAVASRVRRFVYLSTAHVYGTFNGRISEKTQVNPLSDYAIAHYAAEQIVKRFSVSSHLKSLLLRPNAVFGIPVSMEAFDRWFLIPYAFPLEAVYNERITLRTSGEQRRNFLSVDDLSLYVEKFLESEGSDDSLTIINPIGPETLSVYQFALRCAEIYTELTGQGCIVSRPAPAETDVGSDFVYDSMHVCFWTGSRLDNYLHSFTQRLVEDKKQGRRYGTVDDPR